MMESAIVNCAANQAGGLVYDPQTYGSFLATDSVRAPPLEPWPESTILAKSAVPCNTGRCSKTAEQP